MNQLGEGSEANAVVMAIVAMAHAMDIAVTAEGVETEEQRALLQLLGCDNLQGFLLAKPLPEPQLLDYLRQQAIQVA